MSIKKRPANVGGPSHSLALLTNTAGPIWTVGFAFLLSHHNWRSLQRGFGGYTHTGRTRRNAHAISRGWAAIAFSLSYFFSGSGWFATRTTSELVASGFCLFWGIGGERTERYKQEEGGQGRDNVVFHGFQKMIGLTKMYCGGQIIISGGWKKSPIKVETRLR